MSGNPTALSSDFPFQPICFSLKLIFYRIYFTYPTEFRFRTHIHKYADQIGQSLQEYRIYVNGEAVLKKYQPSFTTHGKGDDAQLANSVSYFNSLLLFYYLKLSPQIPA